MTQKKFPNSECNSPSCTWHYLNLWHVVYLDPLIKDGVIKGGTVF